jgi:hypothetical protein
MNDNDFDRQKSPQSAHIEFKTQAILTKTDAVQIIAKGTVCVVLSTGNATEECSNLLAGADIVLRTKIPTSLFPRRNNWSQQE